MNSWSLYFTNTILWHKDKLVVILVSSSQKLGLEHQISQDCPHCSAAESHKPFCLLGPVPQPPCEPVWPVHPWRWALLYENWEQAFPSTKVFCLNDQLVPQLHELVKIGLFHSKILSLTSSRLRSLSYTSKNWKNYLTDKLFRSYVDTYQSPQSRCKLACPKKQL